LHLSSNEESKTGRRTQGGECALFFFANFDGNSSVLFSKIGVAAEEAEFLVVFGHKTA